MCTQNNRLSKRNGKVLQSSGLNKATIEICTDNSSTRDGN